MSILLAFFLYVAFILCIVYYAMEARVTITREGKEPVLYVKRQLNFLFKKVK